MFIFVAITTVAAVFVALAVKYFVNVGWVAVTAATAIVAAVVAPATFAIGSNIAIRDATTFHEYWNGYETAAKTKIVDCRRDGSCVHEYNCDPYQETYYVTVTDSKGNSHSEPRQRTAYHDCPYSTQETTYYVESTLDSYTIASNYMTGNDWRAGHPIPGGRQEAPAQWTAARERVESGKPGPVTAVKNYANYILASSETLFSKYEGAIEQYKADGMLTTPSKGIYDNYNADKAYFVGGVKNLDQADLKKQVAYLNGASGVELQGDVHVVFAPATTAGDPTDYSNALLAYWQSKELGRDAISKNSIIVVVGVDKLKNADTGDSYTGAKWVKAFTGMPLGNEYMLTQVESELKNAPIDASFIGTPNYTVSTGKITHSDGKLESILWGDHKFERVSMTAGDDNDKGAGFEFLKDQLKPSAGAIVGMSFVAGFIGLMTFFAAVLLSFNYSSQNTAKSSHPFERTWSSSERKRSNGFYSF